MSKPNPRGALVIGAGFIGTHVAREFCQQGVPTKVLTRSPPVGKDLSGATVIVGNATDALLLEEALWNTRHVVYCAGGLMPADSAEAPLADVNLTLPPLITVLEALRSRPMVDLTFLSSGGTVYGVPERLPVDEDHPTNPRCPYGVLKLAAEKYIGLYRHLYGLHARILRCANIYGEGQPSDRGQGVVAAWMQRIQLGQPLTLFGDGSVVRDYLYVGDLASLVVRLRGMPGGPAILNVGSGVGTSLASLLSSVREVSGQPVAVEIRPARDVDVPRITLDISRIRAFVPFDPSPLIVGLQRTWARDWDARCQDVTQGLRPEDLTQAVG